MFTKAIEDILLLKPLLISSNLPPPHVKELLVKYICLIFPHQ